MLFAFLLLAQASSVPPSCTLSNRLANASVWTANLCPFVWASSLSTPRGIVVAENGDIIVVERGQNRISVLWDTDGGQASSQRAVLATQTGLNHGIAYSRRDQYLYASTPTDVYRWRYVPGTRTSLGTGQRVLQSIPSRSGGHSTRTLAVSPDQNYLYVSLGSYSNVDNNAVEAMIRRFNVSAFGANPVNWLTGQVVADGLRNEVAMNFDKSGRFWGVENGIDNNQRPDWGGDIHNDNPCEELNLFESVGQFYGYPYCWSEGVLASPPGKGAKTQWVEQKFMNTAPYNDNWCQNKSNVVPPYACLDAHTAPLDIAFGNITDASGYDMTAFVSLHGSWNRTPPNGYRVEYLRFSAGNVNIVRFLEYSGSGATGSGWIRPVGLGLRPCRWGTCLFISSDTTGTIIGMAVNV